MIKSCEREFEYFPKQAKPSRRYKFSSDKVCRIELEIYNMLEKNIIELAEPCDPYVASSIFIREEKDGSLTIIPDLTELNKAIVYRHFKMDSIRTVVNFMFKNCFAASTDLKDSY